MCHWLTTGFSESYETLGNLLGICICDPAYLVALSTEGSKKTVVVISHIYKQHF